MVQQGLNNFQIINCPDEGCTAELRETSPYFVKLREADRQKLMKIRRNKYILMNPEIKICRKEDCDGFLNTDSLKNECEICKESHCPKCLEVTHKGRCDKSTARVLEKKYKLKHCPNCKMVVQKNTGCDHITCHCSYEFCYLCGKAF